MHEATDDTEKESLHSVCSKSYKAKRSLHQHMQNTHHSDSSMAALSAVSVASSLPTQIPLHSALLAQHAGPATSISEMTKSLLRETLELQRRSKDSMSQEAMEGWINGGFQDRLPTPQGLVNLLQAEAVQKGQQADMAALLKAASMSSLASLHRPAALDLLKQQTAAMMQPIKVETEEQAQDLSVRSGAAAGSQVNHRVKRSSPSYKRIYCEFCNKYFKHQVSLANHIRTAHNIIVNFPDTHQGHRGQEVRGQMNHISPALSSNLPAFTRLEPKTSTPSPRATPSYLPEMAKYDAPPSKYDAPPSKYDTPLSKYDTPLKYDTPPSSEVSMSPYMNKKPADRSLPLSSEGSQSASPPTGHTPTTPGYTGMDSSTLDESNALPYHTTSQMTQDLSHEELFTQEPEKQAVLAEDGGQRRYRISVMKETILATKLDGINNVTGRQCSVFKCHLCKRVFTSAMRFHQHLTSHLDSEVTTYDCRYCDAAFRSHPQIVKHLQCHRDKFPPSSVALPLDDAHKKPKDQTHGDSLTPSLSSSNASYFSPSYLGDDNLASTPAGRFTEAAVLGYNSNNNAGSNSKTSSKMSESQLKYTQLLSSLSASAYDHNAAAVAAAAAVSAAANSSKIPTNSSDSNNNSNSKGNNNSGSGGKSSGPYPSMVDMKAIDLRRGEEVAVRMATEPDHSLLAHQAALQEYQRKALMSMSGLGDKAAGFDMEQEKHKLNQRLMQVTKENEAIRYALMQKESEKMKFALLQAAEENRKKILEITAKEEEEKRHNEQVQLKEKLAEAGMGDVTVVLPDAPPLEQRAREQSAVVDFSSKPSKTTETSNEEEKEEKNEVKNEVSDLSAPPKASKRPSPEPSSALAPPSKSRRKAFKPQRINHKASDDAPSSGTQQDKQEGKPEGKDQKEDQKAEERTEKMETHKTSSSSGKPATAAGSLHPAHLAATSTLSQLNHLANMGALGTNPHFAQLARKQLAAVSSQNPLGQLMVTPGGLKYLDKALPPYPTPGMPLMFGGMSPEQIAALTGGKFGSIGSMTPEQLSGMNGGKYSGGNGLEQSQTVSSRSSGKSGKDKSSSSWSVHSKNNANSSISAAKPISSNSYNSVVSENNNYNSVASDNNSAMDLSAAMDLSKKPISRSNSTENGHSHPPPQLPTFGTSVSPAALSTHLAKLASSQLSGIKVDTDGVHSNPRVQWTHKLNSDSAPQKPGLSLYSNSNSNSLRGSSPSPAPSPTHSDASNDGKRGGNSATSLSRTHSRLSVVQEPVDRNMLCRPQVLEDGRQVYACAICHKHFLSLSDINRHMDFHEDIRPYKCKYCDYFARTNSQLKVHKLRHEGVREFCCSICNYKGVTQSDLNRHMKSQVHVLRSQNLCVPCGEGFVTPRSLDDHKIICTGSSDKSFTNVDDHDMEDEDEEVERMKEEEEEDDEEGEECIRGMTRGHALVVDLKIPEPVEV